MKNRFQFYRIFVFFLLAIVSSEDDEREENVY